MVPVVAALLISVLGAGPAGASDSGPGGRPGGGTGGGSTVAFGFHDPAITESSGLVVTGPSGRELVVTTNDSGDVGRVFAVDPRTGDTVGVTTWSQDPVDVEALAPAGPGEVWVADIGDNDAVRPTVRVTRVPVGRGDLMADAAPSYELTYPGGPRDAETLLVDPQGRLLVVSKGLLGGEFYRAEAPLDPDRPTRLTPVGRALPFATDGAFLPDGRHLIVRSYGSAAVYAYPSLEVVATLSLPDQEQGEGIAVDGPAEVLLSSEGEQSEVLRLRLPRDVRRVVAPPEPAADPAAPQDPATPQRPPSPTSAAGPSDGSDGSDARAWALGGFAALGLVILGALVGAVVAGRRALRPRG